MKFNRSFFVSLMGGFCRGEKTKIIISSIASDVGLPTVTYFMPRDAFKPRPIRNRFFNIFHVFRPTCNSQVAQSIIRWGSVNMINFSIWPFVVDNSPSNPVSAQKNIIYSNYNVSSPVKTRNNLPSSAFSSSLSPKQISRVRVVRKKLLKSRNFWMFHEGNMATLMPLVNRGKF